MSGAGAPVAVVGTGVIGAAWVTLLLARGRRVRAHDPAPGARDRLRAEVQACWPAVVALGGPASPDLDRLDWADTLEGAVRDAGFVQENGPETLPLKQDLVARIDAHTPDGVVVASSSSGVRPSDLRAHCTRDPSRVLVGHPFHPAHLVPLVEVVGGEGASQAAVEAALRHYVAVGKRPIHVRQELPGHVVNRLQAALWREAYSLVERGVVTVAEVDTAVTNGPGLRWAAIGPFTGQHLSGGAGGIAHTLEHLGPPMAQWWAELGEPTWSPALVDLVVTQTERAVAGHDRQELSAARDRVLLDILAAKARETDLAT